MEVVEQLGDGGGGGTDPGGTDDGRWRNPGTDGLINETLDLSSYNNNNKQLATLITIFAFPGW